MDFTDCGMTGPVFNITPFAEIVLLPGNNFHGPVPESWRDAKRLRVIDLSGNSISGAPFTWGWPWWTWETRSFSLPPRWPLTTLNLRGNPLGISVEFMLTLAAYYDVEELDLSNCSLGGFVVAPYSIRIPYGDESYNSFRGSVYTNLRRLDLSFNSIINFGFDHEDASSDSCWASE